MRLAQLSGLLLITAGLTLAAGSVLDGRVEALPGAASAVVVGASGVYRDLLP